MAVLYKSYEELLEILQNEKNLIIEDMDTARHILRKTGYFSLISGYKNIFKNVTTGKYIDGTKFMDIYGLYHFDNVLRSIFLKYMLLAERSVKSSLAYHFSETYGEEQQRYLSLSQYEVTEKNKKDILKLIGMMSFHITENTNYEYITHYKNKYCNVPLWIMVQVLTMGQISHMFDYLKAKVSIKICKDFKNINRRNMHTFLSVMTKHRNVCAHGERFFNYRTKDSITDTPIHEKLNLLQRNGRYQSGKTDVFSEVIILKYLLDEEDFSGFYFEVKGCFRDLKPKGEIIRLMGFPENWEWILNLEV